MMVGVNILLALFTSANILNCRISGAVGNAPPEQYKIWSQQKGGIVEMETKIVYCQTCGEYLGDMVDGVLFKFGRRVTDKHECLAPEQGQAKGRKEIRLTTSVGKRQIAERRRLNIRHHKVVPAQDSPPSWDNIVKTVEDLR